MQAWPGILIAISLFVAAPAGAQPVAVIAPLSDTFSILGAQMRAGALAATEEDDASPDILALDDACTAEGGAAAAQQAVSAGAKVVVGFLCTESIEAALPILKDAGVPVITPGVRTDSLTDNRQRTGWPVFRLAARADAERIAASALLLPRWRDALFALVDDGTIYGRELVEAFRLAAESSGLKPVFVDTYRPQMENQVALVGRLRRAGATHLLVGGDRDDIAIIGRDAAALGISLTIAGGETLRAASNGVELAEGTLMIALPDDAVSSDEDALTALADAGVEPEGYVLPAYAATQIALQAVADSQRKGTNVAAALAAGSFETAIGTITFDAKGDLSQNPYRLFRFEAGQFNEVPQP